MIRRLVPSTPSIAKINLVPIIDVALTLVIILLITGPMIAAANLGLDLPKARSQATPEHNMVHVTLGREGELAVGEEIVGPAQFRPALAARLGACETDGALVVIRADSKCSYQEVGEVIRMARDAGAKRIGIGTRSEDGGRDFADPDDALATGAIQ